MVSRQIDHALILASRRSVQDVRRFLSLDADINASDPSNGQTALMCASQHGRQDIVDELLKRGADVDAVSQNGNTALLYAIRHGNDAVIQMLLDADADVFQTNENQDTALTIAMDCELVDVVRLLLTQIQDISTHVKDESRLLSRFIDRMQDYEIESKLIILRILIEKGIDVDASNKRTGRTALMIAAKKGYVSVVRFLIKKGADVHATDFHGRTALIESAREGHADIVGVLLKKNTDDVNAATHTDNTTALIFATRRGHADVVKILLDNDADPDVATIPDGLTALIIAIQHGYTHIVRMLLDAGADFLKKTTEGLTAVDYVMSLKQKRSPRTTIIELVQHAMNRYILDRHVRTKPCTTAQTGGAAPYRSSRGGTIAQQSSPRSKTQVPDISYPEFLKTFSSWKPDITDQLRGIFKLPLLSKKKKPTP